jgi:hypothetical protein
MPRTSISRTVKTEPTLVNKPIPYTPFSHIRKGAARAAAIEASLEKALEKRLAKNVREMLRSRTATAHLAPFALDGVRLLNYLFDATHAAEKVPLVRGFEVQPVTVSTTSKRGYNVVAVADILMVVLQEQLAAQKAAGKLQSVASDRK